MREKTKRQVCCRGKIKGQWRSKASPLALSKQPSTLSCLTLLFFNGKQNRNINEIYCCSVDDWLKCISNLSSHHFKQTLCKSFFYRLTTSAYLVQFSLSCEKHHMLQIVCLKQNFHSREKMWQQWCFFFFVLLWCCCTDLPVPKSHTAALFFVSMSTDVSFAGIRTYCYLSFGRKGA